VAPECAGYDRDRKQHNAVKDDGRALGAPRQVECLGDAHRLRQIAATEMLRAGASLPEVAEVLRHRDLATTAIYAKVDRRALRALARPWPGGAA
jgi:site-specific recombinase XerC